MSKEKTVKLNQKQVELLREAITNQKTFERIKIGNKFSNEHTSKKEQAIANIYEYEDLEKKLN